MTDEEQDARDLLLANLKDMALGQSKNLPFTCQFTAKEALEKIESLERQLLAVQLQVSLMRQQRDEARYRLLKLYLLAMGSAAPIWSQANYQTSWERMDDESAVRNAVRDCLSVAGIDPYSQGESAQALIAKVEGK